MTDELEKRLPDHLAEAADAVNDVVSSNLMTVVMAAIAATAAPTAVALPVISAIVKVAAGQLPGQRLGRLVDFAVRLEDALTDTRIDVARLTSRLQGVEGQLAAETVILQAVGPTTTERRRYLANLLASSVSAPDFTLERTVRFAKLLDQMTDEEVILLRSYEYETHAEREAFNERHAKVLELVPPSAAGSSDDETDADVLQQARQSTLERLGLLDPRRGSPEITWMGRMLVRYISEAEVAPSDEG
jgi:predicted metalloendopeptidase